MQPTLTTGAGWKRWWVVAGSLLAMAIGSSPLVFVTFSVMMPVITADLGWSRGQASVAITAYTLFSAIGMPLCGRTIDRIGLIPTLIFGSSVFVLAFLAVSTTSTLPPYVVLYAALGLFGTALAPLPYGKAVTATFDRNRGLALGVAMAGYGVGSALVPLLAQDLIERVGWRSTYQILGGLAAVGAAVAILLIRSGLRASGTARLVSAPRETVVPADEAAGGSWKLFVLMAVMVMLTSIAINGILPHLVSIARDKGVQPGEAVGLLTIMGIASICGRVITGWLLDRLHAAKVGPLLFLIPMTALGLLAFEAPVAFLPLVAMALGFGLGVEVDLIGYLVGRYYPLRRYGEVYGWLLGLFSGGSAIGPLLLGISWDVTGSYVTALYATSAGLLCAIVLAMRLPPYLFAPRH